VLLAPLTATLVSDLLIEGRRDPALAVMSPDRFDAPAIQTMESPCKRM
jgi:hypothetical protein